MKKYQVYKEGGKIQEHQPAGFQASGWRRLDDASPISNSTTWLCIPQFTNDHFEIFWLSLR